MNVVSNLDTPLFALSPKDKFTLRDAVQGIIAFGGIGVGKSTGLGNTIRAAFLRAQMGGVVMVAKPEEVPDWLAAAAANGRSASVLRFDETQGFNFIEHALSFFGLDGVGTIVDTLMRVLEAADHAAGNNSQAGEEFWSQSMRQWLSHIVPALYIAHGKVTIPDIVEFVTTAATDASQFANADWVKKSYAGSTLERMADNPSVPVDDATLRRLMQFWFQQFPAIPDKTRGNIMITLTSKLDRFLHGRLKRCFCEKTTILPEMMFHGAVILMDMPVLSWKEDGIIGQQLFLHACERVIEARNGMDKQHQLRPVFIYADECQYFLTEKDEAFLSTCRGSRACPVFLTQTLPTIYSRMGHTKHDAAAGLIGKCGTQVFLLNACQQTNEYASKVIGRGMHQRKNTGYSSGSSNSHNWGESRNVSHGRSASISFGAGKPTFTEGRNSSEGYGASFGETSGSSENWSEGSSEVLDNIIEPNFFAQGLKSGGPRNKGIVSAVWFKAGAAFHQNGGRNFMIAEFQQ